MCQVCKKETEMGPVYLSNDIKINEAYDDSDSLIYCKYCGVLFMDRYDLGNKELCYYCGQKEEDCGCVKGAK